jgi:hypothetical protein
MTFDMWRRWHKCVAVSPLEGVTVGPKTNRQAPLNILCEMVNGTEIQSPDCGQYWIGQKFAWEAGNKCDVPVGGCAGLAVEPC